MTAISFTQEEQAILGRFLRSRTIREQAKVLSQRKKPLIMRHEDVNRVYLDGLVLPKSDFYRAKGLMFYAREAQLPRSNFEQTMLWSPFFIRADLRWCNFKGAKLYYASFWHANLRSCDFRGADLEGANFEGADVTGCLWDGANLEGVRGLLDNKTYGRMLVTADDYR